MFLVSQLINQGPVLFVYLVAGYFSIIYMSRARLPSMLTLIGVIILFATIIGQSAAQAYLFSNGDLRRAQQYTASRSLPSRVKLMRH